MAVERPRLTIALPVFNGARFLAQTVRSVLEQTFSDFELIIGDNASTDATGEIAQQLVRSDPRIRYVRNEQNLGLAGNYNALFRQSTAELFKWAPSDDAYEPEFLARCVAALDGDPRAVLAYCQARFVDTSGRTIEVFDPGWDLRSDEPWQRLLFAIQASHWVNSINGVIRREALARTQLMPRYSAGDYVLLGELSLLGTFLEIPEPLYLRRLHPGSSSQIRAPERLRQYVTGPGDGPAWPTWQRTLGHLATVLTAPVGIGKRARLLGGLTRASADRMPLLRRELMSLVRWLLSRRTSEA